MNIFSYAAFSEQVNTIFQVQLDSPNQPQAFQLLEANNRAHEQYENFTLLFQGPQTPIFPQGTYLLMHPALGEFSLFLVPVKQAASGIQYEAIINQFKP
jgi:hypothetical protein